MAKKKVCQRSYQQSKRKEGLLLLRVALVILMHLLKEKSQAGSLIGCNRMDAVPPVRKKKMMSQCPGCNGVGVEIWECELRMKILLIFTLCLISDGGASKEVTGYSGGGVLIKCKYDTKYREKQKYFCKGSGLSCSDQIKTGAKNEWINSGRFSLFDDTKSAEFSVMIRELTVEDTGTYQCGVDLPGETDIYTRVELKVKQGELPTCLSS
ncbi:hypothetical protein AMELA_G00186360 [Ameiurus melas]|uniref:Ig-like domain-containing protein n=1 Tax=Ameiurus melas TaxID=219545 RepID=A0A7J6AAG6_AMEME|nr:hypothetical protein AMELA_G00186360 [Ameiurus melas]